MKQKIREILTQTLKEFWKDAKKFLLAGNAKLTWSPVQIVVFIVRWKTLFNSQTDRNLKTMSIFMLQCYTRSRTAPATKSEPGE
jgi:hypothetical protein